MVSSAGNLFIIVAPSGVGKTSLIKALSSSLDKVVISVSYTTRPIGAGEINGQNYYFVDDQEFTELLERGEFLEYAKVYKYWYGTPKSRVTTELAKGNDVLLDIDWQGMRQVQEKFSTSSSIYLLPPSKEIILERLLKRDRDNSRTIKERMDKVMEQVNHCSECDYVIVNDDFNEALGDLASIIQSYRLKKAIQLKKYRGLLESLLAE